MKKVILLIVAICSIATMFYFSSRNAEISSSQSQIILDIIRNFGIEIDSYYIRKLAHFIIFMLIGFCISMFIGSCVESDIITVIISFILSSGYACIDEYIQTFIPGRNGNVNDVMIDICGVIGGIILYFIIIYLISNN
jgi:VanZ family protein